MDGGPEPDLKNLYGLYRHRQPVFPAPPAEDPPAQAKTRFAVLLAARNEEAVIGRTVGQLLAQQYPAELFDVYVIPNNCTDDTEGAARRAGAQILPAWDRCGIKATPCTAPLPP